MDRSLASFGILWCLVGITLLTLNPAMADLDFVAFLELPRQPCGGDVSEHIGRGAKFVLNGTRAVLYPLTKDAGYDSGDAFVLQLASVVENRRNYTPADNACDAANQVVQALDINDCACTRIPFLRLSPTYRDEGFEFRLTDCHGHPDLVVSAFFSVSDNEYVDTFGPTMNGSTQPSFDYVHPAGGLKVGVNISRWGWASEAMNNETYVSVGFLFAAQTTSGGLITQNSTTSMRSITLSTPTISLALNLDRGIFLNGIPSISGKVRLDQPTLSFLPIRNFWLALYAVVGLCSPDTSVYQKWDELVYDPSFVSLFAPAFDGPSSDATPTASRKWVVPVAVSVSVIVVILVAALALASIFIPSVRNFFRPFSARKQSNHVLDTSQDWKKASKPSLS